MRGFVLAGLLGVGVVATLVACSDRGRRSAADPVQTAPASGGSGANETDDERGVAASGAGAPGSAGAGASDVSDADTDADPDADSDVGAAGAAGAAQDDEPETLPDCEPVQGVTPFDCNVELCTPPDILTVSEGVDVPGFHDELLGLLAEWVDESCFSTCEPPVEEYCDEYHCVYSECTAADCTTSRGAVMTYSRTEIVDDYYYERSIEERIVIQPAPGEYGFSELEYEFSSQDREGFATGDGREHVSVSWQGSVRADWPSDFSAQFGTSYYSASEPGHGSYREWQMMSSTCNVEYLSIDLSIGESKILTRGERQLAVVERRDGSVGYANDECLGEVDPDTFEIIGPAREGADCTQAPGTEL